MGCRKTGDLTAPDEAQALDRLAQKGLVPLTIRAGRTEAWWARELSFGKAKAPLAEQERFLSVLATMLDAKLPLPRSLRFCAGQIKYRPLRRGLEELAGALEDGQSLEQALSEVDHGLPSRLLILLSVGDRANRLGETASAAASQFSHDLQMTREIRAALVYPAILVLMAFVVMAVLVFYLAPTLLPVFESSDMEVPAVLVVMAGLGDAFRESWILILPGIAVATGASLALWLRLRDKVLGLLVRAPLIGNYLRRLETLRLLQAFRIMLTGGAHLTVALDTAAGSVRTAPFRKLLEETRARIEDGASLRAAFANADLLDEKARLMIEVGEEGDRLREAVATAAETLAEETKRSLAGAVRLMTPLLTLLIGGTVAGIMMTTIGAIMDLNDIAL